MKACMFGFFVAVLASQAFAVDQPKAPVNPGFEKMKSLVGQWKGKTKDGENVTVSYRLVAGGTVIEEQLSHGDMVTMYHLDGGKLMLTHYCVAQNQPRMRAAAFKEGDKTLSFAFFDATNMADPKAMHMHNLALNFSDADHFTQEWTLYQDGKETQTVVINLERMK